MKKLYYTIEFEFDSTGESKNGNKNVTLYTIENNEPTRFGLLEMINEENTEGGIQIYLDDNGYSDDDIKLVLL